jgi:hypothetical protein
MLVSRTSSASFDTRILSWGKPSPFRVPHRRGDDSVDHVCAALLFIAAIVLGTVARRRTAERNGTALGASKTLVRPLLCRADLERAVMRLPTLGSLQATGPPAAYFSRFL